MMFKAVRLTALVSALFFVTAGMAAAQDRAKIRISLNPLVYSYIPLYIAIEKGYIDQEGIELVVSKYNGSSTTQMPLLARGDLDISPVVGGPALFNQYNEGFGIKLMATNAETHAGWSDGTWVLVRKDLWDSGAIRTLKDLKGRAVDAGPEGSPINFLTNQALKAGGLTRTDVKYSGRLGTPPDWLAALRNNAVDVLGAVEPVATQIVEQGYGVRLTSAQQVMPWWQESYWGASKKFLDENRSTAIRFVKAMLRGAQEVDRGGPQWTADELRVLNKWSNLPEEELRKIPTPPYVGQFGAFRYESLSNQQDYWLEHNQIKAKVPVPALIDEAIVTEARRQLGL
jgi:NitT/TauT family transport system substrate-binding protein